MTIEFWVPGDPDTPSGGYAYDRRLAGELRSQGHQVAFVRLDEQRRASRCDLILQDELAHADLGTSNRRLPAGVPVVVLVHHLKGKEEGPVWRRWSDLARESRYLQTADAYLFNSLDTQHSVQNLVPGAGSRPSLVLVPGLDPQPRSTAPGNGSFVLFSLGAVTHRKGQLRVARALQKLGGLDWRWVVAGPLDAEPETVRQLNRIIRRNNWHQRVELLGWVDGQTREALWNQAVAFVLPADYEGYGMAVLEASARGLAVVAGTKGGINEVITPGVDGLLVSGQPELTAALRRLATDPALRQRLGAAGAARQHPTWEESFRTAGPFLESLLPKNRSGQ